MWHPTVRSPHPILCQPVFIIVPTSHQTDTPLLLDQTSNMPIIPIPAVACLTTALGPCRCTICQCFGLPYSQTKPTDQSLLINDQHSPRGGACPWANLCCPFAWTLSILLHMVCLSLKLRPYHSPSHDPTTLFHPSLIQYQDTYFRINNFQITHYLFWMGTMQICADTQPDYI